MPREILPFRRRNITVDFEHVLEWGVNSIPARTMHYIASLGYYHDGRLGEIFVASATKLTTQADIAVRDQAIGISIGLQYGADAEVLVPAFLRDSLERPEGVMGQLLKKLADEKLLRIAPYEPTGPHWR